jgi:hypothetical protein
MSIEDPRTNEEAPSPPGDNAEQGTYALGIWEGGQTLYRFENHPLDPSGSSWVEVDHFGHDDEAVQDVYFERASAKPEVNEDGGLVAVWLYTQSLSREPPQPSPSSSQSDSRRPRRETGEDGEERTLGDIGENTAYHRALSIVDRLTDGENDAVSVKDISNEAEDPKGTVYSAMTKLWERKLVERKERDLEGERNHKVYWLSPYGKEKLEELGQPDSE